MIPCEKVPPLTGQRQRRPRHENKEQTRSCELSAASASLELKETFMIHAEMAPPPQKGERIVYTKPQKDVKSKIKTIFPNGSRYYRNLVRSPFCLLFFPAYKCLIIRLFFFHLSFVYIFSLCFVSLLVLSSLSSLSSLSLSLLFCNFPCCVHSSE